MGLNKFKITSKGLYWGLIITFVILYLCVGFVSTLHAITFFQMANSVGLAILLALAFEVGQSSVLFSILMAKKEDHKWLPWFLMFLLTALQITGNVFASFKHIMTSGNMDWQFFQKSVLFGVQASSPEMYQVIISWMQGALLPVIALGLTALIAQDIQLKESEIIESEKKPDAVEDFSKYEFKKPEVKVNEPKADEILTYDEKKGQFENKKEYIFSEKPTEISIEDLLPSRETQLKDLKNAIVNNIQKKGSPLEMDPLIGEGGIQIVKPPIEFKLGPQTQEEANEEYAKSIDKDVKIGEGGIQVLQDSKEVDWSTIPIAEIQKLEDIKMLSNPSLAKYNTDGLNQMEKDLNEEIDQYIQKQEDEEVSGYGMEGEDEKIPKIDLKLETINANSQPRVFKVIEDDKIIVQPSNKIQGWHFMKEFVDKDHNVFQRGAFVKNDPEKIPTKSKKA